MAELTVGTASASSTQGGTTAAYAFDRQVGTGNFWWASSFAPQWLQRDLGSGNAAAATWYAITPYPGDTNPPSGWTFEGSNDASSWTVLDTRSGITYAGSSEYRAFTFTNTTAYRYYRWNITAPASGSPLAIAEAHLGTGSPDSWLWGDRNGGATALSGAYTLGVVFVPAVSGVITHFRGYRAPGSGGGTVGFNLYDTTGASLASGSTNESLVSPAHWYDVALTTPVAVTAGTPYMVSGYYPVASAYFTGSVTSDLVHGDLKIPANGTVTFNGSTQNIRYANGNGYPTLNGGGLHLVGVQFRPDVVSGATGSGTATAPTATASGTGTSTVTGSGTATGPTPTGSGSGTSTATATGTATAPTPTATGTGASDDTSVGDGTATAPTPGASGTGTSTVTGSGTAAAPSPGATGTGDVDTGIITLSAPSPRQASVMSFETYTPAPEVLLLSAPSIREAALRINPTPVPVPAGIFDHPLMRRAHLMPAKTAVSNRRVGDPLRLRADGSDGYVYPIEETAKGRLRVFASGLDVTYLTGAPTTLEEWGFAKPFSCQAARFSMPLREWQKPGADGLTMLWSDASVEVALEDENGDLTSLWDGYTAEESDTAAPGQTGVTFNCEGTLQQAKHWLWDAPIIMGPRDVGHVIADAMNSVPNHRYVKVKRFTTGVTTTKRGDSSQSVLAYVAELIAETFDDTGNQLHFRRVGPFAYELDWCLPVVTPHWTFTKGSPGFNSTLTRPHSSRRDAVFARGFGDDGGFWMGRVFPGLVSAAPPTYPMADPGDNMNVGTTDADTVGGKGVSTWQRKMRLLGYPVVVDGVMNSSDSKWVLKIQKARGLTEDSSLGPQTWAATWEGGEQTPETETYRSPLAIKPIARRYNNDASGRPVGDNVNRDRKRIVYATPDIDAGTNIKKSQFIPKAEQILEREGTPGYVGSLTATGVDPWEVGTSRFFIDDADNVLVLGHHGGTVVQCSDVTHTPTVTRMTVDSRARGQAVVDAVMSRQTDARRTMAARQTRITDRGTLNASQLGQFESESPAGKYSRTAINGDSGLWTVRCIYVAEQGLARFMLNSSPAAEMVTAIFSQRVTPNQIAAHMPNPLASTDGWYDAEKVLRETHGLIEVAGTPGNPGGYFPRQKPGDGVDNPGPLTGEQAAGNLSLKSRRGGFFWVAVFTSRSTFVEGEFDPEVSTA